MKLRTGERTGHRFAHCDECGWNCHGEDHHDINHAANEHRCPTAFQRTNAFARTFGWEVRHSRTGAPETGHAMFTNYQRDGEHGYTRRHACWTAAGELLVAVSVDLSTAMAVDFIISTRDESELREWL